MGHIDHGKTTLLDYIRTSTVAAKEAGGITQHIGATEVPFDTVDKVCGDLLKKLNLKITIPGFLFIDTPGHAAFTHLRKRGGSIADIGILIVDINDGFMPQTYEALNILKTFKTPFVVVANKIDALGGWQSHPDRPLLESFMSQKSEVQQAIDTKLYSLVEVLFKNEFSSERFDRVKDFTEQIAVVPMSAKTGEGVPEFLMVLTGITQRYMEEQLKVDVTSPGKGSILEVKQTEGLGTTLDVILYDGRIMKGDTIVVGTRGEPIETTVKALMRPDPLEEIRIGKRFKNVDGATAAAGIKIAAPNIDEALPGSPVFVVKPGQDSNPVKEEVRGEIEQVRISTEKVGVIVKADTLGSLEALVKMLEDDGITVKKAGFGDVSRKDVIDADAVKKESNLNAVIFAFNVKTLPGVAKEAEDLGIKVLQGEVVYSLIDEYKNWVTEETTQTKEKLAETTTMPGKIKLLPGYVFRQSKPAVCGVEVLAGRIKTKCNLVNEKGESIGSVKGIQEESKSIPKAGVGKKVAVSISGAIIGKNINEGDVLYVRVPGKDLKILRTRLKDMLSDDEVALLDEIEKIGG